MSRSDGKRPSHGERKAPPSRDGDAPIQANGWTLLFHPLFLDQVARLLTAAEAESSRRSPDQPEGPNTKLVKAIHQLIARDIPEDPARPQYRQGGTLGASHTHWRRAKFGNGRFRLFFRYRTDVRLIVFAWVNDENTLRTYGSRTDAYSTFRRMLSAGNPPDDWDDLMQSASGTEAGSPIRSMLKKSLFPDD